MFIILPVRGCGRVSRRKRREDETGQVKAALYRFSRMLAVEFGPQRLRVNGDLPGLLYHSDVIQNDQAMPAQLDNYPVL